MYVFVCAYSMSCGLSESCACVYIYIYIYCISTCTNQSIPILISVSVINMILMCDIISVCVNDNSNIADRYSYNPCVMSFGNSVDDISTQTTILIACSGRIVYVVVIQADIHKMGCAEVSLSYVTQSNIFDDLYLKWLASRTLDVGSNVCRYDDMFCLNWR